MMMLKRCSAAFAIMLGAQGSAQFTRDAIPTAKEVGVCALQTDPADYDQKTIRVSGIVSHGFEQFVLSDPKCGGDSTIWLEYGGDFNSDTVYCCGSTAGASRGRTLVIDGITLPLIKDALFRRFDARIRSTKDVKFQATIEGHFFAGVKQQLPGGERWGGYGHIGCCTLLVIQRVLAVDLREGKHSAARAAAEREAVVTRSAEARRRGWSGRT